jgi:hypothetical protein
LPPFLFFADIAAAAMPPLITPRLPPAFLMPRLSFSLRFSTPPPRCRRFSMLIGRAAY